MAVKQNNTPYYSPSKNDGGSGIVNHDIAKQRVGNRFWKVLVTKHLGSNKYRRAVYECLCDCGNTCVKSSISLNVRTSCGCDGRRRQAEARLKHGGSRRAGADQIYATWCGMKRRCYNQKSKDFKWYGGKGIRICKRWHEYAAFRDDMMPTYSIGLTIERKDSSKDYSPENCEWITGAENARRAALSKWASKREDI